jgi:hypothetical protein
MIHHYFSICQIYGKNRGFLPDYYTAAEAPLARSGRKKQKRPSPERQETSSYRWFHPETPVRRRHYI